MVSPSPPIPPVISATRLGMTFLHFCCVGVSLGQSSRSKKSDWSAASELPHRHSIAVVVRGGLYAGPAVLHAVPAINRPGLPSHLHGSVRPSSAASCRPHLTPWYLLRTALR